MTQYNFEDMRPYNDGEINAAMHRIVNDPIFNTVAAYLYPGVPIEILKQKFCQLNNVLDFQLQVMHHAIYHVIKQTMTSFTCHGLEQLDNTKSFLFVGNHRDIVLDSAILQLALYEKGFRTSEITFGSNLMKPDFVVDFGKSNKMFKVERGGNPRDLYHHSLHLSRYIRHTITEKDESIWIAQRNGRTKDGNDFTDQGLLKMFNMSGKGEIIDNLSELNIVPLSISYQWEPCDVFKTRELYISKREKYVKAPNEDLQSILTGINQFKGEVHIEVCPPLTHTDLIKFEGSEKNELFSQIANLIDTRIHSNYKLTDNNFIAFDLQNNSSDYLNKNYSAEVCEKFKTEMDKKLSTIDGDKDELKEIYLGIYANPVKNALNTKM